MNLGFYLGNQDDPIAEGYLQLVADLPPERWMFVRPVIAGDVVFPGEAIPEPDWYGWRKAPWKIFLQIGFLLRLRSMVARNGVERIFHYGIPSPWTFVLATFLLGTRARFVLFVHDPKSHAGERPKQRIMNWLSERLLMRRAAALVASYEGGRRILTERALVPPGKVHVARLPMLARMGTDRGEGIPSDLLFFGRLEAYKGLEVLEHAVEILAKAGHRPKVLVVGRGPERNLVVRMAARHPNVRHVETYLSNDDLAAAVRSTRIVVLPYLEATGSHGVQIANYHGVPVVATSVGAFPEHILHGVNGSIVPPGDPEAFAQAVLEWLGKQPEEIAGPCRLHADANDSSARFAATLDGIVEGSSK